MDAIPEPSSSLIDVSTFRRFDVSTFHPQNRNGVGKSPEKTHDWSVRLEFSPLRGEADA